MNYETGERIQLMDAVEVRLNDLLEKGYVTGFDEINERMYVVVRIEKGRQIFATQNAVKRYESNGADNS